MPKIEKVAEGCIIAEGPHWDIPSQSLFFVDIFGKQILKYTPSTKKLTRTATEQSATIIIPVEGRKDEFVITLGNELVLISWNGENEKYTVMEKICDTNNTSFNDAKCDSSGRLWIGSHTIVSDFTKTLPLGFLHSIDATKKLKNNVDKIRVANGITFNENTGKMFFIDSLLESVDAFDFDIKSGNISNRQTWFTLKKFNIPGLPDGMTIDSDGNLWVAVFEGGRVIKIDGTIPETLLETIEMPDKQVTSVAFGGENFDELYVTTGDIDPETMSPKSDSKGAAYRITGLGVKGVPAANFKLHN